VRLLGPQKASVAVEGSANLTNWTQIATNTLPVGGLPLSMPMGTNRQFFRARIPQPMSASENPFSLARAAYKMSGGTAGSLTHRTYYESEPT
jgi:hypothetical protein